MIYNPEALLRVLLSSYVESLPPFLLCRTVSVPTSRTGFAAASLIGSGAKKLSSVIRFHPVGVQMD